MKPTLAVVDVRHLASARAWGNKRDLEEALTAELGWTRDGHTYRGVDWDTVVVLVPRFAPASLYAYGGAVRARNTIIIADARDLGDVDYDADLRATDDAAIARAFGVAPALDWDGTPESTRSVCFRIRDAATEATPSARAKPGASPGPTLAAITAPRFTGGPWRALPIDPALVSSLANRCCVRDGRPLVFGTEMGTALDVSRNVNVPAPELPYATALNVDGTRFLRRAHDPARSREAALELVDDTGAVLARALVNGLPFSFADGWAGVGWRCTFTWLRATHDALTVVAGCAHDWPVGHAKKQLGYRDNEPCALTVAPDGGAYVSRFDRDTLVAATVPLAWRKLGPVAVLDWPPEDTLRRLFFIPDWGLLIAHAHPPRTQEAALAEDAREEAPVLVVGPDDHHRYALDLSNETWAILGADRAELVGGPNDGYLVYDATHAIVRRGSGRLLTGTARSLYVHDDGTLFREDFVTGAREELGRESEPIHAALAFPGADNALLVGPPMEREDGVTTVRVRLI